MAAISEDDADTDDGIVKEAKKRFRRCEDWESTARRRWLEDTKFANADSDNMYQWPDAIQTARGFGTNDERPCLTINKTQQHCLQIINDARQNKASVKIKPVGDGASYEASQVMEGIVRHIEYISDAQAAYGTAIRHQVEGGIGYLRVATDYAAADTFEQEIYIRRVKDPLTIYVDPDFQEADGSDMRFAFVFDDMPKDEFKQRYPGNDDVATTPIDNDDGWIDEDHVRVAEYFRRVERKDRLIVIPDGQGGEQAVRLSSIPKAMRKELEKAVDAQDSRSRDIVEPEIEWFLIAGDRVIERRPWAGKYIPIVRVPGTETVIDGELDRKGHVRALKDPQRMYNYNAPLALDTPLPTPDGWTTIGQVKGGDWLLSEKGEPVQVLGVSPIFMHRDCYRVEFDDGSSIVADRDHQWEVEERGSRRSSTFLWQTKTVSTKELSPDKHFIYISDPLDGPDVDLPIDPYVLGAWLGDGDSRGGRFTAGAQDVEEMRANLAQSGYHVGEGYSYADKSTYSFTVFGLRGRLAAAGVLHNKHIPAVYLRSSLAQRLALLQGLMDTDGSVSRNKQCVFVSGNEAIQSGFAELLRTLGLKAFYADVPAKLAVFPNGRTYESKPVRRFAFSVDPSMPVFRMARKAAIQTEDRRLHPRRTKRHRIVGVTPVPSVPVRCLGVDSERHLFLAGEGMVPTHNSAQVEFGALQSKIPYMAPAQAIEGYETYWETANTANYSVLPWNHKDDDNGPIPPPQRAQPPVSSPAYQEGMQNAANDMMLVSGQYQADFGAPSNERSGVAIQQRQRQGDTATYHFIDHQAMAMRFVGKIIIDLMPKIYDQPRVVKILAEDGTSSEVLLDPQAKTAYAKRQIATANTVEQVIVNPAIGRYDVMADVGPAFATRRQEAFNAFTQIVSQNKELVNLIGDLMFKNADFPGAEEIAERLKRMVPPQALGEGPTPEMQQLVQQNQALHNMVQALSQKLQSRDTEHEFTQQQKLIDAHKAETSRLQALGKALGLAPAELLALVKETMLEALGTHMPPEATAAPMAALGAPPMAPAPGAQPMGAPQPQPQMAQ